MNKLVKRIKESRGESLAEVLVAILISSAGLLLLSSMMMSADKLTSSGQSAMRKIYTDSSAIEARTADLTQGTLNISYTGGSSDITIDIYSDEGSSLKAYSKE